MKNRLTQGLPVRFQHRLCSAAAWLCLIIASQLRADPPEGLADGIDVEINYTAYYIAWVTPTTPSEGGKGVKFTDLQGNRVTYYISKDSYRRSEMQAVATAEDKEGKMRMAFRTAKGEWKELPEDWLAMGNRSNPLVPWHHVAADQKKYPFGSMIYSAEADGHETVDGKVLDGYFWVADVGGLVKGATHIDIFVGHEEVYDKVLDAGRKRTADATIYKLPKAPEGFDPKTKDGLVAILAAQQLLDAAENPPGKEDIAAALLAFQKAEPKIPEIEHGLSKAATTLWFLTQAAIQASKDKE